MRNSNELFLLKNIKTTQLIGELKEIEEFLDDFNILLLDRNYIVCKNHVFSFRIILNSCHATLGNIINCFKCFCLADAYNLLRKYRDDLFFLLYILVYDLKDKYKTDIEIQKMEANIERWCKNKMNNLYIKTVLTTIYEAEHLKDAVNNYGLKKSFDIISRDLNNYVHGNGQDFYNVNAGVLDKKEIEMQLNEFVYKVKYITTTFMFLLVLSHPSYIMATDYIDCLDLGHTPTDGLQYCVAHFVEDFLKKNISLINENCYEYLKDRTDMEL